MLKLISLVSGLVGKLPSTFYIIGAVALAGASAFGVQTWRLHSAQVSIARAQALTLEKQAALDSCTVTLKGVGDQIAVQNSHVAALEAQSEAQQKALDSAEAQGAKAAQAAAVAITTIETSAPTADAPTAIDWLATQGADLAKNFGSHP
jgi:hypothetical protein